MKTVVVVLAVVVSLLASSGAGAVSLDENWAIGMRACASNGVLGLESALFGTRFDSQDPPADGVWAGDGWDSSAGLPFDNYAAVQCRDSGLGVSGVGYKGDFRSPIEAGTKRWNIVAVTGPEWNRKHMQLRLWSTPFTTNREPLGDVDGGPGFFYRVKLASMPEGLACFDEAGNAVAAGDYLVYDWNESLNGTSDSPAYKFLFTSPTYMNSLTFDLQLIAGVPEPSGLLAVLSGLCALAATAYRKKRA